MELRVRVPADESGARDLNETRTMNSSWSNRHDGVIA